MIYLYIIIIFLLLLLFIINNDLIKMIKIISIISILTGIFIQIISKIIVFIINSKVTYISTIKITNRIINEFNYPSFIFLLMKTFSSSLINIGKNCFGDVSSTNFVSKFLLISFK